MNASILTGLALVATLGLSTPTFANQPGGSGQTSHANGSGHTTISTTPVVCKNCPTPHHSGKSHKPPPGTGGYKSAGYGNDGGGFRIKPQGGVQHVPPLEPVTPAQTQTGGGG